jgi:palmitoyltransferase
MWSAYKGFPACVELFLRWGANVYATDETGFTALHWAMVRGDQAFVSMAAIQKLIEYGSDRFAESSTGKTPAVTAEEMKCTHLWHRALEECGYDEDGNPISSSILPFASYMIGSKTAMSRFFFLWPSLILICVFLIVSKMPVVFGVPLAVVVGYGLHWVALQALQWAPVDMKHMHRTVR